MSKKHFIALADAIIHANKTLSCIKNATGTFTQSHLDVIADFCQAQNSNFNRERWMDYIAGKCGKNGGKVKVQA